MFFTMPRTSASSFKHLEREGLFARLFVFEHELARKNDVAALAVELDDAAFDLFASQRVEILDRPNVNLRPGQERANADVDRETAFDSFDDAAANDGVFVVRLLDFFPNFDLFRFFLGKDDVAVTIFRIFEQDIDDIADLDRQMTAGSMNCATGMTPSDL